MAEDNQSITTTTITTPTSLNFGPTRLPISRIVQNFLLIWLDANIDQINNADSRDTITQLRQVVNSTYIFTNVDECIEFITGIEIEKAFMIVSGSLGEIVVPQIHHMSQLSTIYVLCADRARHEKWATHYHKVHGVFTQIAPLCGALRQAAQDCDRNSVSMSIVRPNDRVSKDELDPSFMYTQILKEILLTIDFEAKQFNEFLKYCREQFAGNTAELRNISKFESEYHPHSAIWWYTYPGFLYSMLNRALRLTDVDLIITMGFFIRDLHVQIAQIHAKQYKNKNYSKSFTVYRGQGLSHIELDLLCKSSEGLMSFNSFLSTSMNRDVSLTFAKQTLKSSHLVGVLFVIKIDPQISGTCFANIANYSSFEDEDEVLISMPSIFRIQQVLQIERSESERLWQVELTLTSDNDPQLRMLTEYIREETLTYSTGWHRLGQLLLKMGEFDKAQQVYNMLFEQINSNIEEAYIYNQLGKIKYSQGRYQEAIDFYTKSLEIHQQTLPVNHPDLASYHNNIGAVYQNIGEYLKALSFYMTSLGIYQKCLPPNHPSLAIANNNMGAVYQNMGEYSKALSFYEKALEINLGSLPANHPDLATSYQNMATVYSSMSEYSKALSFYEKALEIKQKALPTNHPDLATSYQNMASVYYDIGEYSKAISFYEKTLEINQKSLPANHPSLAISWNNMAAVYSSMGDYSKALSFYEKALELNQTTLPPNHPDLATSYQNMATVYSMMGEYSKALSSYGKALSIRQKSLPPSHPDLASSYNNIGLVYENMGEYAKALSFLEKSFAINQQSLPPNHPDLATSLNNIAGVYESMGEYSKALSYLEKALVIKQKSLPTAHPSLASSYSNIGLLYHKMGEYSKAISFLDKAISTYEKSLPSNHPNFAISYNNIGLVLDTMGEYSQALFYHDKALKIREQSLPAHHPDLAISYNNMGLVYDKLDECSKALSYYEKALEIYRQALPANHPNLGATLNNMAEAYANMKDYANAHSHYQEAVKILQGSLPQDHPHLQISKANIDRVKNYL